MDKFSSEEKLQILTKLNAVNLDQYFIFDVGQHTLTWLNRNAEPMASVKLEDIIHSEDLQKVTQSFEQFLAANDQNVITRTFRLKNDSGGYRWTQDRITVHQRDATGEATSILGLATDIHEAKMAANEEVSRDLTHEINNPLTVIHARSFQLNQMVEINNVNIDKVKQVAESIATTADKISQILSSHRQKNKSSSRQ